MCHSPRPRALRPPRRRASLSLILLLACLPACSNLHLPFLSSATRTESLKRMDPVRIQADTMGFADRFVTAMTGVCDQIELHAASPAVKDDAHQIKTDLALGAIGDAVNPRPVAGLMDMVVLVRLLREIAEDPRTTAMFGPDAPDLVESLKRQEADLHTLAAQYLTDAQLTELNRLADQWHQSHPAERTASHTHLADLPEANRTPIVPGKAPSSVFGLLFFDPTADLDPAVREIELSRATSERMFFYFQRLPLLLQLQAEGFYRQVLEIPEFTHSMDNIDTTAATITRFTDLIAAFPRQLSEERQQTVHQLADTLTAQREAAIQQLADTVTAQRQAAISQAAAEIAAQRDAVLHQIDELATRQRRDAIADASAAVTAQRQFALDQLASTLDRTQQNFIANLQAATDRSSDRFLTRLSVLALAFLIVIFVAARLPRRKAAAAPPAPRQS